MLGNKLRAPISTLYSPQTCLQDLPWQHNGPHHPLRKHQTPVVTLGPALSVPPISNQYGDLSSISKSIHNRSLLLHYPLLDLLSPSLDYVLGIMLLYLCYICCYISYDCSLNDMNCEMARVILLTLRSCHVKAILRGTARIPFSLRELSLGVQCTCYIQPNLVLIITPLELLVSDLQPPCYLGLSSHLRTLYFLFLDALPQ